MCGRYFACVCVWTFFLCCLPQKLACAQAKAALDNVAQAEETVEAKPGKTSDFASPELLRWLEQIIRRNLPETYTNDKDWGQQKEVWNGVKLRREGLKLETKRKRKLVNSGTWTRYSIALVEPEQNLKIEFRNLETLPNGKVSFSVVVETPLDVFGRLSQWARDVQLISISANADAACRLHLAGTVEFRLNPLRLPPTVSLKPHVHEARIELTYYRVRRISQIGGDFAKTLGKGLRTVLDDKLEDLNAKLVTKINRQLDKHADKLKFDAQAWLQSKLHMDASESK